VGLVEHFTGYLFTYAFVSYMVHTGMKQNNKRIFIVVIYFLYIQELYVFCLPLYISISCPTDTLDAARPSPTFEDHSRTMSDFFSKTNELMLSPLRLRYSWPCTYLHIGTRINVLFCHHSKHFNCEDGWAVQLTFLQPMQWASIFIMRQTEIFSSVNSIFVRSFVSSHLSNFSATLWRHYRWQGGIFRTMLST
jgi:hypothetical protein